MATPDPLDARPLIETTVRGTASGLFIAVKNVMNAGGVALATARRVQIEILVLRRASRLTQGQIGDQLQASAVEACRQVDSRHRRLERSIG